MDDFFDARSLLGSLQQVFSSAMASSVTSAAGSTADFSVPCDLDLASSTVFAMHDLAASVREVLVGAALECAASCMRASPLAGGHQYASLSATQVGVALRKRWAVSVVAPAIVLAILYQDAVDAGVDSAAAFAPRLVVEVQDVVVAFHTEASSRSTSALLVVHRALKPFHQCCVCSPPVTAARAASAAAPTALVCPRACWKLQSTCHSQAPTRTPPARVQRVMLTSGCQLKKWPGCQRDCRLRSAFAGRCRRLPVRWPFADVRTFLALL